jgi:peptidoglycan-binding lysin domain protein|nr:MAG TPA: tail assembly protein [Caudoviricetes sp.]
MQIWLKGSAPMRFPVLPNEYKVQGSRGIETVNINAVGETDLGGMRGLRTVSFSSFFPKHYDPSYCEFRGIKNPQRYVKQIEQMMNNSIVKLIITGTAINFPCRISSFEWGEDDGTGDIRFSITLKEHKKIAISKSSVVAESQATTQAVSEDTSAKDTTKREDTREKPKTYTVKRGDSLSSIARKLTGSADWHALYEQNKSIIGSNPNLIKDGTVLVIP